MEQLLTMTTAQVEQYSDQPLVRLGYAQVRNTHMEPFLGMHGKRSRGNTKFYDEILTNLIYLEIYC